MLFLRPFRRFAVSLLSGLLLCAGSSRLLCAQTAPLATTSLANSTILDVFSYGSEMRNPLQADPLIVARFLRPWLFTMDWSAWLGTSGKNKAFGRSLPQPKNYTLTPDPFSWTLPSTSPDEDDYAYLPDPPPAAPVTTAEKMAESGTPHHVHPLPAKYDISEIGNRGIGNGLDFYSTEKEIALGRELSFQVEQSARLLTDPVVNEYVNRVGQTLVRHSDCKVPFTIKVIDDDEVNAFALPGGFFYVNTGAILVADDEAELAGVMAHEIAHVCARHATRNATKAEIAQYATLPLVFFAGPVAMAARELSGLALPLSYLKFSRDAEREADLLGMQYQFAAGYDPTAFVDFFEKLEADEKTQHGFIARAFSTHPMTADRVKRAEDELETLPPRESYITDTSEFDQVRERLARLTRGRALSPGERPHPTLRHRRP